MVDPLTPSPTPREELAAVLADLRLGAHSGGLVVLTDAVLAALSARGLEVKERPASPDLADGLTPDEAALDAIRDVLADMYGPMPGADWGRHALTFWMLIRHRAVIVSPVSGGVARADREAAPQRVAAMANEVLRFQKGPHLDDHADYCHYRQRSPALREDCGCGVFRRFRDEADDAAEALALLVVEGGAALGVGEAAPDSKDLNAPTEAAPALDREPGT